MPAPEEQIKVSADVGRIVGGEPGRILRSADAGGDANAGAERRGGPAGEFRNTCGICNAKINYAFARRADIPGVCGQCLDKYRRKLRTELTTEILGGTQPKSGSRIVHYFPKKSFLKGVALGLVLGFLGAVLMDLYGHGTFDRASAGTHQAIDQSIALGKQGWRVFKGWLGY